MGFFWELFQADNDRKRTFLILFFVGGNIRKNREIRVNACKMLLKLFSRVEISSRQINLYKYNSRSFPLRKDIHLVQNVNLKYIKFKSGFN